MSTEHTFRGVFTALITPMHENGDIDWASLESLVHSQIEDGIDGLVPVGTTGESPTLNAKQHVEVIETVVRAAAGRVPLDALKPITIDVLQVEKVHRGRALYCRVVSKVIFVKPL